MGKGMGAATAADATWSTQAPAHRDAPAEYVCWTRMQAEAGQALQAIVARKELERRAGDGLFFWGVGNAPATIVGALARLGRRVPIIFSIMKTRPKIVDVAPSRTVVWRRYIDAHGAERPLPSHALITSRGDSATGSKRVHYALMCHSDEPLAIRRGESFDPAAFRNAGGTGAPVGASQVTALLQRVAPSSLKADYEANIRAWLAGSYWVRLTDPVELDASRLALIATLGEGSVHDWRTAAADIRNGSPARDASATHDVLL